MTTTTRREQDRAGYHEAQRAAEAMRADARGFRAIAAEAWTSANPSLYGPRAQTYADGLAARYELLAEFAEYEATRQDDIAADLRLHLTGERP